MPAHPIYWRCFHCGAEFTRAQAQHARDHFGDDEFATPACQYRKLNGEAGLIKILRQQERELARHRSEDTDILRAMHGMSADYERKLCLAEEAGYEKGLRDGRLVATGDE